MNILSIFQRHIVVMRFKRLGLVGGWMAVQHILLLLITIHDQTLHNLHISLLFAIICSLLIVNV